MAFDAVRDVEPVAEGSRLVPRTTAVDRDGDRTRGLPPEDESVLPAGLVDAVRLPVRRRRADDVRRRELEHDVVIALLDDAFLVVGAREVGSVDGDGVSVPGLSRAAGGSLAGLVHLLGLIHPGPV